ncbi:MAG: FAD-binding oxidoreductase [Pseudomonadota bacterium]|uniref:D-2-hydroxyglutarate dehydrogenase n=1 Tax=Caballeronia sordidicola TaxID=196367 RepID=A0A242N2U4_CABSO|nr:MULTISPECIES: FAD-binding oxidoreductase [Burkholderiaceae]AMH43982.1 FAD-linked oxidase [Burkholderia sp. PAMC 26561]MDP9152897.1 FAD-binding oxidoreductase [Pseudomonadota bacterium]OTP77892.1 D-2-hydroxyglutarate dehydrogenase [Caballeronia sordidicola]OTP80440.1 D-2-hydroxyglutarate dehydrogenase [Caballeronia sordidicola]
MAAQEAVHALREALGSQVVQLPEEFGDRRVVDWSGLPGGVPLAVIRPRDTAEVAKALHICSEHGQPVVTQGGLTGLVGGANVQGGEVAISLDRMNKIVEIDPVSSTMTVEAGTPLQVVQEAATAAGFYFPLDLGARGSCSIGGNLATNAGGNRVIKYGMMRDQVLGLEAVLASGKVIGGLNKMIKDNSGYDLRHLLIGSEGTLAIITRAVLRLRPKPTATATAWCGLPSYEAVTTLLSRAQARLAPGVSAFEVMWKGYYDAVLANLDTLRAPLDEAHPFYVLLESVGTDPVRHADAFEEFLGEMLEAGVVSDAALASSDSQALAFWAIRDAPGEYQRFIPNHAAYDVSFSIAQVGEAAQRCDVRLRERWPDAIVMIYGHLGDGNIHVVVDVPGMGKHDHDEIDDVIYDVTRDLQGSISAEHGIGTKKKHFLHFTRSDNDIESMRAIKSALDPHGLLNPGKVF